MPEIHTNWGKRPHDVGSVHVARARWMCCRCVQRTNEELLKAVVCNYVLMKEEKGDKRRLDEPYRKQLEVMIVLPGDESTAFSCVPSHAVIPGSKWLMELEWGVASDWQTGSMLRHKMCRCCKQKSEHCVPHRDGPSTPLWYDTSAPSQMPN